MPVTLGQALFSSFLNRSFEVMAVAYDDDGDESVSVVATEPGRLRPMRPSEVESAQRLDVDADHILYVATPTEIVRGHYVRDAERPDRYRVVGLREPSLTEHHLAVYLKTEVSPAPPSGGS